MKKLLLTITSIAWLLLLPAYGLACSCDVDLKLLSKPEHQQIKIALKKATAVFSGKVIEITFNEQSSIYYAKFKVQNSWKNVDAAEVIVSGLTMCCLCDWVFKVGESYLIYVNRYDPVNNVHGTDHCTRSNFLNDAEIDLKILGKGKIRNIERAGF